MKHLTLAALALALLPFCNAASAQSATDLTRPIASFDLTLMPPGKGQKPFGWIELLDRTGKPSGYIYLEDSDDAPRIGGGGTYIVTHLPYSELSGMIAILQSVKPLQIRYAGVGTPSVFIESSGTSNITPEIAEAARLRKSQ